MLFATEKTKLTARIAELESTNAEITERLSVTVRVNAEQAARITEIEAINSELQYTRDAAITAARQAAAAEVEATVAGRVNTAVTDALASAGMPTEDLPARGEGTSQAATIEDLREQLDAEQDPVKAGAIVAQIKALKGKIN
jgi:C4-dicarboxylate-specific signal transduction histidine kinase